MAQNMFSPGQTATTEAYRDNYERIFSKQEQQEEGNEDLSYLADPYLNEGRN